MSFTWGGGGGGRYELYLSGVLATILKYVSLLGYSLLAISHYCLINRILQINPDPYSSLTPTPSSPLTPPALPEEIFPPLGVYFEDNVFLIYSITVFIVIYCLIAGPPPPPP